MVRAAGRPAAPCELGPQRPRAALRLVADPAPGPHPQAGRDDGVRVRWGLAWAGGAPVPGARTERQFLLDGAGLCVRDELVAKDLPRAVYTVPAAATEVLREPRTGPGVVSYRLA